MEYFKHLFYCNSGDYFGYLLHKEKSVWENWHFDYIDSYCHSCRLVNLLGLFIVYRATSKPKKNNTTTRAKESTLKTEERKEK